MTALCSTPKHAPVKRVRDGEREEKKNILKQLGANVQQVKLFLSVCENFALKKGKVMKGPGGRGVGTWGWEGRVGEWG